jgi:error-prone DNA polymerase
MGLRFIKGLGEADGQRLAAAAPFSSVEDFVARTALNEKVLAAVAESGAFDPLGVRRRSALWQAQGLARSRPTPLRVEPEETVAFAELTALETINWDYRRTSHSAHGHPLAPLRDELTARGLPDARTVAKLQHGQRVRYAGMVICRQHPGTASGVTFMTLEDETGFVNLVLWRKVFVEYSVLAKTQAFLGVTGKLQSQDGVVHVVAESLWAPELLRRPESGGSRDFH